jgi:hypothetical protein
MDRNKPSFDLGEFLMACSKGPPFISFEKQALRDADSIFHLSKESDVRDFIVWDEGLKQLRFLGSGPLIHLQGFGLRVVDEYDFTTGSTRGYIAFGKNEIHGNWRVKSFHEQRKEPVFNQIENAFRLAIGEEGYKTFRKKLGE